MSRFHEARELGEPFTLEHRIRAANGAYRWFLARAEPEMDPATGRPRRWYGTCVDIHERRIAEARIAEADRRKEEFLATLAHELRNPLAPIRTGLAVLDMNPPLETAAKTRAAMARQLCHMVRFIDDLLDVSRINNNKIELQLQAIDLRAVLKEAIEATQATVEAARHELIVSTLPPPSPLRDSRFPRRNPRCCSSTDAPSPDRAAVRARACCTRSACPPERRA
jgi:signal transduction histidine kinase